MNELAERLKEGYERIIYPTAMGNMPVELEKMAKHDGEGNLIGSYSINELSQELGKLLVPIPFNKSGTLMSIRWSFDKRITAEGITDEQATRALFKRNSLVDMLDGKEAKDIVIGDLVGNEFGILGSFEFKQIPNEIVEVVEEVQP